MSTFITNCQTFVSGSSVVTVGMRFDVAVRDERGLKQRLPMRKPGKQLPLSHRSSAPADHAASMRPAAIAPPRATCWRLIERSSSRRYSIPAYELPAAVWATLVLARAA
jgi:hypothetical protein